MTKKKEPGELKKRGRKETIYNNGDLSAHLAGVTMIKHLTKEAQAVLRETVKGEATNKNSDRAYNTRHILFLVCRLSKVSQDSIKYTIEHDDKFSQDEYSEASVKQYKKVTVATCKALSELWQSGVPIRADQAKSGSEYYTLCEMGQLKLMLENCCTKDDFEALVKKFSDRN
ncbi:hypothetical protein [Pantoea sp. ME81]|uniref:hypothetical protein n=1 Tax=Pantoea sp. ME81 TaxID=2743935 RepID=UPI0015F53DCA|nr:hypothetical protein [Pantoea sp. ME81]